MEDYSRWFVKSAQKAYISFTCEDGFFCTKEEMFMTTATLEITKQAMALPADDRTVLALRLWESVEDFVDPEVECVWSEEVEKRWTEIQDGTVQGTRKATVLGITRHIA
jgi:hypothetical protein